LNVKEFHYDVIGISARLIVIVMKDEEDLEGSKSFDSFYNGLIEMNSLGFDKEPVAIMVKNSMIVY
jgi:hypothetical protein